MFRFRDFRFAGRNEVTIVCDLFRVCLALDSIFNRLPSKYFHGDRDGNPPHK
jgi:hypothetical protein